MKYLIFSDVHGSYSNLEKIINVYEKESCNELICLGDVLYHGPRNDLPEDYNPKKVVNLLNKYSKYIKCCQGNCDAEVDQMVLDFKLEKRLTHIFELKGFLFEHGHHLEKKKRLLTKAVFYGHTHIMSFERIGKTYYINPGSISIPKLPKGIDSELLKTFIILENNVVKFYSLKDNNNDNDCYLYDKNENNENNINCYKLLKSYSLDN